MGCPAFPPSLPFESRLTPLDEPAPRPLTLFGLANDREDTSTVTPASEVGTAAVPRRVLVVDDNVSSAETLALLIGLSGHETRVAHSGFAALAAVESQRPDIVLLDIGLPGMDGYEVARRLRQGDGNGEILLVAVTGYAQDDDRRKATAAGFNHHLVKPLDFHQLEKILLDPRQGRSA